MMVSHNFNDNPPPPPPPQHLYVRQAYYDNHYVAHQSTAPSGYDQQQLYGYDGPPPTQYGVEKANQTAPKRKGRSTTMTPETAERNRCRICNKQFSRPSSLQTHYYSHTGEKLFKCPWEGCGKLFSVKLNMKRHYRLHERDMKQEHGRSIKEETGMGQEHEYNHSSLSTPTVLGYIPQSSYPNNLQTTSVPYNQYTFTNLVNSKSQVNLNSIIPKSLPENPTLLLPNPLPSHLQTNQVQHIPMINNPSYGYQHPYDGLVGSSTSNNSAIGSANNSANPGLNPSYYPMQTSYTDQNPGNLTGSSSYPIPNYESNYNFTYDYQGKLKNPRNENNTYPNNNYESSQ